MTDSPLRHYLHVLRRHALIVIGMPLVAILIAAFAVSRQESIYQADMKIFVGQVGGGVQPAIGTQPLTQTMTNLLQSDVVVRTAIERAGVETTPKKVIKRLKVGVKPDSSVLDVSIKWPDKAQGVALLGEISKSFTQEVKNKLGLSSGNPEPTATPGTTDTGGAASPRLLFFSTVFDPPHAEDERVSPKPASTLAFAGILGLLLGIVLAFVRETLDDRIRGRGDAEEAFEAPVIGALPRGADEEPMATLRPGATDRRGLRDAVSLLRANLRFSQSGVDGPTVLVTSGRDGEGTTEVTACVALALALGGKRVVCVDAHTHDPKLHETLGVEPGEVGLVDVVRGRADLHDALVRVDLDPIGVNGHRRTGAVNGNGNGNGRHDGPSQGGSLRLLPAGGPFDGSLGLEGDAIRHLVEQLAEEADYVIIDSPPLLTSGDAFPLALQSDNVIVAARNGRTTKGRAEATRETLKGLGAQRVSVVLTHTTAHVYADRGT